MKIAFITLGCKVNIYESNAIKEELTNRGHIIVGDNEDADCYIINTCSVTNMADAKSRKMIRKCIKAKKSSMTFEKDYIIQPLSNGQDLRIKPESVESIIYGKNGICMFYKKARYCSLFIYNKLDEFEKAIKKYLPKVKKYIES